jgi:hypothetical protein
MDVTGLQDVAIHRWDDGHGGAVADDVRKGAFPPSGQVHDNDEGGGKRRVWHGAEQHLQGFHPTGRSADPDNRKVPRLIHRHLLAGCARVYGAA